MKKLKILVPIATIGTLATAITPMSLLTSCSNTNTGDGANLINTYVCQIKPEEHKIYTKEDALDAYFDADSSVKIGDDEHCVLKDDLRYSLSLAFKTDKFKERFNASYCTLRLKDVTIDKTNNTILPTFVVKYKGDFYEKLQEEALEIKDADVEFEVHPEKPWSIEFCKSDETTLLKQNYIKITFNENECWLFKSTGKLVLNGNIQNTIRDDDYSIYIDSKPTKIDRERIYETYYYFMSQILVEGLTRNLKKPPAEAEHGIWYTNYMSLAEIKNQ